MPETAAWALRRTSEDSATGHGKQSDKPVLATARWPIKVQDRDAAPVPDARFMVSYAHREEKGSDVNVASHLLLDTLAGEIDGAVAGDLEKSLLNFLRADART